MKLSVVRWFVAALAATVSAAGLTAVWVSSNGTSTPKNWTELLTVCAKSEPGLRPGCFEEVFYAAYSAGDIRQFNTDLEIVERDNPLASYDCHTGGHQAGRRAAASGDYVNAILGGVSVKNICGNGFIHGAFDEVGHQKAGNNTFQELSTVCDKVPQEVRYSACVDGYGHSVWLRTYDLGKALELCLFFDEATSKNVCLAGVIMQMYRVDPFDGSPPVMSIDKADNFCGLVRERTNDDELVRTCFYEAAWPLGVEAGAAAEEMLRDRPAGLQTWMPPTTLLDKTRTLYREAFNKCDSYSSWADLCREKIASSPIWRVSGDPAVNTEVCQAFPVPYAEHCTNQTRVSNQSTRLDEQRQ
jgi:hypothetical protein